MKFLRSHLFIAIVSLFVLTAYGFDLFDGCCARQEKAQAENGKSAPKNQTPGSSDGCQCICHQLTTAVPLGIDYLPQLA